MVNVFTPVGIGLERNNDFKNVTFEKKREVVNALTPVGSESSFSSKSSFLSRDRSSSFRVRCSWAAGAAIATAKKQLMINMAFMVSKIVS